MAVIDTGNNNYQMVNTSTPSVPPDKYAKLKQFLPLVAPLIAAAIAGKGYGGIAAGSESGSYQQALQAQADEAVRKQQMEWQKAAEERQATQFGWQQDAVAKQKAKDAVVSKLSPTWFLNPEETQAVISVSDDPVSAMELVTKLQDEYAAKHYYDAPRKELAAAGKGEYSAALNPQGNAYGIDTNMPYAQLNSGGDYADMWKGIPTNTPDKKAATLSRLMTPGAPESVMTAGLNYLLSGGENNADPTADSTPETTTPDIDYSVFPESVRPIVQQIVKLGGKASDVVDVLTSKGLQPQGLTVDVKDFLTRTKWSDDNPLVYRFVAAQNDQEFWTAVGEATKWEQEKLKEDNDQKNAEATNARLTANGNKPGAPKDTSGMLKGDKDWLSQVNTDYNSYLSQAKANGQVEFLDKETWVKQTKSKADYDRYMKLTTTKVQLKYRAGKGYTPKDWTYAAAMVTKAGSGANAIYEALRQFNAGASNEGIIDALIDRYNQAHGTDHKRQWWIDQYRARR